MFEVTGRVLSDPFKLPRTLRWDAGRLGGDPLLVSRVLSDLKQLEGVPIGPPEGPTTITRHVRDGISTLTYVLSIMEDGALVTGNPPQRPPIPEGMIG